MKRRFFIATMLGLLALLLCGTALAMLVQIPGLALVLLMILSMQKRPIIS